MRQNEIFGYIVGDRLWLKVRGGGWVRNLQNFCHLVGTPIPQEKNPGVTFGDEDEHEIVQVFPHTQVEGITSGFVSMHKKMSTSTVEESSSLTSISEAKHSQFGSENRYDDNL